MFSKANGSRQFTTKPSDASDLGDLPPAPRGMPQIEVTFDIDANGILNVSAKDTATGKEQKITITASSGLSEAEIDQMVKDAESHAEEDKQKREEVETRNRADSLVYETEKNISEFERQDGRCRQGEGKRRRCPGQASVRGGQPRGNPILIRRIDARSGTKFLHRYINKQQTQVMLLLRHTIWRPR